MDLKIGANRLKLSLPAEARGAHARAGEKILDPFEVNRTEGVAGVLALGDGCDFEAFGQFGGEIFERVHGEIHSSGSEGFFNFFCEHALGSDHGESDVGNFVAGGVDDLDFDFMSASTQERGDVVRLPQGKFGTARAYAKFRGFAVGCRRSHFPVRWAAEFRPYGTRSSVSRFPGTTVPGSHLPSLRDWVSAASRLLSYPMILRSSAMPAPLVCRAG